MSSRPYDGVNVTSEWRDETDEVFAPQSTAPSFQGRATLASDPPSGAANISPRSRHRLALSLGSSKTGEAGQGRVPQTPQRSPRSPRVARGSSPRPFSRQTSINDLRSGLHFDEGEYGGEEEERETLKDQGDRPMDDRKPQRGLGRSCSDRTNSRSSSGSFSGPRTFRSSFKEYPKSTESSKDVASPTPSQRIMLEDDDDDDDAHTIHDDDGDVGDGYRQRSSHSFSGDVIVEEDEEKERDERGTESNEEQSNEEEEEEHKMTYSEMYEMCCKIRKKRYYSDIYNIWLDQVHETQRDEAIAILQRTGFDSGSRDAVESVVLALRNVPERFFDNESVTTAVSVEDLKTLLEESMSSWEDLNRRQKLHNQSTTRRRAHCIRINPGVDDMEEYRPDPRTVLNQHLSLNMLNLNIPSYYMDSYIDRYVASLRGLNGPSESDETDGDDSDS